MSIQINTVILGGNLTRDPELRTTPNGISVCEFSIANNHTYISKEEKKSEVTFINIIVWGKIANNCVKYLSKGSGVVIEGRVKQQTWTDDSGNKRSRIKIIASKVNFTSKPADNVIKVAPVEDATNSNDLTLVDIDLG